MSHLQLRRTAREPVPGRRAAFTLVEVLIATAVSLVLMAIVASIFSIFATSVSHSRATIEMADRLRATQNRLQQDLDGITAKTLPPLSPEQGLGYLEIAEGPIGTYFPPLTVGGQLDDNGNLVQVGGFSASPAPNNNFDTVIGDNDDVIMFTTRTQGEPFVGRFTFLDAPAAGETPDGNDAIGPFKVRVLNLQSQVAEVIWFIRGTTLYRRQLLVRPQRLPDADTRDAGYTQYSIAAGHFSYQNHDISMRQKGGLAEATVQPAGTFEVVQPNTLGDLTNRQWRYAHQPRVWPHVGPSFWTRLGMPTLRESSFAGGFPWPYMIPANVPNVALGLIEPNGVGAPALFGLMHRIPLTTASGNEEFDPFYRQHPFDQVQPITGTLLGYFDPNAARATEDVILNNVSSFDVRVWDPGAPVYSAAVVGGGPLAVPMSPGDPGYLATAAAGNAPVTVGAYVDLNYLIPAGATLPPAQYPRPQFADAGDVRSGLRPDPADPYPFYTYDTWSNAYERDGVDQDGDGLIDEGADGIDNPPVVNGPDDALEREAPPPYPVPLRGLQIRVRVFEPDSRQVREVTLVKEFLPE